MTTRITAPLKQKDDMKDMKACSKENTEFAVYAAFTYCIFRILSLISIFSRCYF